MTFWDAEISFVLQCYGEVTTLFYLKLKASTNNLCTEALYYMKKNFIQVYRFFIFGKWQSPDSWLITRMSIFKAKGPEEIFMYNEYLQNNKWFVEH